jgi:hypothetical protein
MRRFVLILICVTVCAGLLAAPAFAGRAAPTQRMPLNASVVGYAWGGWWCEYSGLSGTADDVVFWQASAPGEEYFKAVPGDRPVLDFALTWDITYGRVLNEPNLWLATIDVYGPAPEQGGYGPLIQHVTPQAALQYWTGPYVWDEFWDTLYHPSPPFKPQIAAGTYGNNLYVPLGPFPKTGRYHVDTSWRQARPYTDLGFFAGSKPQHYPSGTLDGVSSLDMYVYVP